MFSFVFNNITEKTNDWTITLNGHEIECSKENAELISQKIARQNSSKTRKTKNDEFFNIDIPEFNDSFVCSETDYDLFNNIFNLEPIQITKANKDCLKIFSNYFEIEDLSKLIKMFEQANDILTSNKDLQQDKEISTQLIDITEDSFDYVIDLLQNINREDNNTYIFNLFLKACKIRPTKTELFISLLKKYDETTKGNQFEYFKKSILHEVITNYNISVKSNIFFIARYLYSINEISVEQLKEVHNDYLINQIVYDKYDYKREIMQQPINNPVLYTKEDFVEYARTGYSPNKIYQAILHDDLESFTNLISENVVKNEFNGEISIYQYERYIYLLYHEYFYDYHKKVHYLDIAAIYCSEKIFNYILLNVDPSKSINENTIKYSFIGGDVSIIHKCVETFPLDDDLLIDCIYLTIKYNHYDVFEWLIENNDAVNSGLFDEKNVIYSFFEKAIQYNNIEMIFYFFSIGIDYSSLFVLSLVYDMFSLINVALELPYNCEYSSGHIKVKKNSPFIYRYEYIYFFFFLT